MKKSLLLLFFFCAIIGYAQNGTVKHVSAEDFKKEIAKNKAVLIDLRTSDEIKSKGKIKGAVQIDFLSKEAEAVISKLDKNKTYLVYCAGGGRSGDAAELMHKQGFREVINLEKGFDDWKRKGMETVTQ